MGWVNWVTGRVELAHIFHIKKKKTTKNKCQLFRENESNQIVRQFVTNLLLYMWREKKQINQKTWRFSYPCNLDSFDFWAWLKFFTYFKFKVHQWYLWGLFLRTGPNDGWNLGPANPLQWICREWIQKLGSDGAMDGMGVGAMIE